MSIERDILFTKDKVLALFKFPYSNTLWIAQKLGNPHIALAKEEVVEGVTRIVRMSRYLHKNNMRDLLLKPLPIIRRRKW